MEKGWKRDGKGMEKRKLVKNLKKLSLYSEIYINRAETRLKTSSITIGGDDLQKKKRKETKRNQRNPIFSIFPPSSHRKFAMEIQSRRGQAPRTS